MGKHLRYFQLQVVYNIIKEYGRLAARGPGITKAKFF